MAFITDSAYDAGLDYIRTNCTTLYITSQEAVTYAGASSTYKLGTKASPSLGANADGAIDGRRFTVASVTDGTVNNSGTATHWALTSGSALLATGLLTASQPVTAGNTFTLAAFDVTFRDAT